jgi:hypothetical protein
MAYAWPILLNFSGRNVPIEEESLEEVVLKDLEFAAFVNSHRLMVCQF